MDESLPLAATNAITYGTAPQTSGATSGGTSGTVDIAGAQKAGQDFEAFFLSQVFENMFSSVGTDPTFGGGNGETIYRSLLLQEYSKVAARSASTGIADSVTREIIKLQESQK
jgi:Rod binding domain-containing protein